MLYGNFSTMIDKSFETFGFNLALSIDFISFNKISVWLAIDILTTSVQFIEAFLKTKLKKFDKE